MGEIINVKAIVEEKRFKLKKVAEQLKVEYQIIPKIVVVLIGNDPASQSYVKGKEKAAEAMGLASEIIRFSADALETEVLTCIHHLNNDDTVNGIIVQLPLPPTLDEEKITQAICLEKDVDGFLPESLGNLMLGKAGFIPCTPKGIMQILLASGEKVASKHIVVVGRSNIVGKPVAMLALQQHATVTICHSYTKNLQAITKQADILIVAMGKPKFITEDFVKDNAIVIDVGVNRDPGSKKLIGDVDLEAVLPYVKKITPVPGGVGPMTITMLLQNTIEAACQQHQLKIPDSIKV